MRPTRIGRATRVVSTLMTAFLLGAAVPSMAQQPVSRTAEATAAFTIEAIDHSARVVTLRNKAGLLEEVYCGPEVQRFDALKVGDTVTFTYFEAVVTALSKPGEGGMSSTAVSRTPGAPGGSIARQSTATVTIETVDPKAPAVTVRTPAGGRSTFKVQNAANLEGYKAGDQVTITYTRGIAVSVTPPASEEPKPHLDIYGFAMLDMGFNFTSINPNWFDTLRLTRLPKFEDEFGKDGSTFAGVRQSRLGVKGFTPTKLGELQTIFEFELFGTGVDEGQTTFRLRHAWGELGAFGAGQFWSPFTDVDVFPNSLEYWGPTGLAWFRNVQFRWTPIRKEHSSLILALERPGASGDQGVYANRIELSNIQPRFPAPDVTAAYKASTNWGYVRGALQLRRIRWDDVQVDNLDLSGSATGWGVNLSSVVNAGKATAVRGAFVFGEGIENAMNDSPVDIGIQNNLGDPSRPVVGKPLPLVSMSLFVDHKWNEKFTSAIGYSRQDIDNTDAQAPDAFKSGQYALGNLLYTPVPNVMVGGELQWGRRENFSDGFTSDGMKLQFSFKYNFAASIGGK